MKHQLGIVVAFALVAILSVAPVHADPLEDQVDTDLTGFVDSLMEIQAMELTPEEMFDSLESLGADNNGYDTQVDAEGNVVMSHMYFSTTTDTSYVSIRVTTVDGTSTMSYTVRHR